MAAYGVRQAACTAASGRGRSPASARAKIPRGETSICTELPPAVEMTAAIAISVPPTGPMNAEATSVSGSFEAAVSGSTPKQAIISSR